MKFIFSLQYSNNYKINEPNLTSKKINSPNITIIDLKANIIPANIFPIGDRTVTITHKVNKEQIHKAVYFFFTKSIYPICSFSSSPFLNIISISLGISKSEYRFLKQHIDCLCFSSLLQYHFASKVNIKMK